VKPENIHAGHRKREKDYYLQHGFANVPLHKILEVLLFFSVPQRDTNAAAHALANKFGTLKNVIDADFDELLSVDGISENSAMFFKLFAHAAKEYFLCESNGGMPLACSDEMLAFCRALFLGAKEEEVYALFLDNELRLIKPVKIGGGFALSADFSAGLVVKAAFAHSASRVVLAHNHPNGFSMPSQQDVIATSALFTTLKPLQIRLEDHVIVGTDGEWSMRAMENLKEIWGN
jgi:DNA repair protein RadC